MLAPKRHTVSRGMSPPSTRRPRACGWPYVITIREGPERLASSSNQRVPIRRAFRCTSTDAKLLAAMRSGVSRSEEHTSELQSHSDLVCRLLLEKKKRKNNTHRREDRHTDT